MKLIVRTYDIVTPESAENGDTAENGFADFRGNQFPIQDENGFHEENVHTDRALIGEEIEADEDEDVVTKAISFLQDKCYVMEPSDSRFHSGVWYSAEAEHGYSDGSYTTYSYHLYGFTEDEERAIYCGLFPRRATKGNN